MYRFKLPAHVSIQQYYVNIKEGYLKQQVKTFTTLSYCIAIIKLKTSGCCGCMIYRFLGFPEVLLKVRLFGKRCLGGVFY